MILRLLQKTEGVGRLYISLKKKEVVKFLRRSCSSYNSTTMSKSTPSSSTFLKDTVKNLQHGARVNIPEFFKVIDEYELDTVEKLINHVTAHDFKPKELHIRERLVNELHEWSKKEIVPYTDITTPWSPINVADIPKALNVQDVIKYITIAKESGKKLRVCGAQHSPPPAVFDLQATNENIIGLKLDGDLRKIEIINGGPIATGSCCFRVGAGCNLGIDPHDPTSTEANSFVHFADRHGYALPILGGISHQTIGGYMSTSTAGGSLDYGFSDSLVSFEFVDGNGLVKTLENGTDEFNAAAVSMGLFGIITHITVRCQSKFLVRGQESTVSYADSVLKDGASWKKAVKENTYQHNVWFPNRGVERVLSFFGKQSELGPVEPYKGVLDTQIKNILAAVSLWIANKFDKPGSYWIVSLILNLTNPISETPRTFNDYWWRALPCDDEVLSDTWIRVQFSEIWIELNDADKVINALQDLFKDQAACGSFGCEIYMAKKSPFWLSMSYDRDCIRIDPYWFEYNTCGTLQKYFTYFWNTLLPLTPTARLHWSKHWPDVGTTFSGKDANGKPFSKTIGGDWCRKSYPKFQQWLDYREKYDPSGVFLTEYWRGLLGL